MGKKQSASGAPSNTKVSNNSGNGYSPVHPSDYVGSLEHIPSGMIITDEGGKAINYNQRAVEILGGIPLNTGLHDWSKRFGLYQPDGMTQLPEEQFPLKRALQGKNDETQEILLINNHTREEKWISISAKPITSNDGKVMGAALYVSDISEFKHAELTYQKKLKQVEAAFRLQQQIGESGNDPLKILNQVVSFAVQYIGDGCIAALLNLPADRLRVVAFHHAKPSARKYLQNTLVSQEFGIDSSIERVVHSGQPLLVQSFDQKRLAELASPNFTKYIEDIGLVSLLVVPIKGRNRILGTLSLVRDRGGAAYTIDDQTFITDMAYRTGLAIDNNFLVSLLRVESTGRRSAEEALELSEARFQSIFTSTALGIKLLDLYGNIIETNPAFQKMVGYSDTELKGKPLNTFWHPVDAKFLAPVLQSLRNNMVQSYQLEHRLIGKDRSTVWANVTFTGIRKNDREESLAFIVAIAENITERKRIEAEVSRMKSRLQSHVELERLRLAQELHDGPLQDLYSAIYKIENWGAQEPSVDLDKFNDLKLDLLNVVQGLRSTAKDLRPPALAEFGLEKAIRSHAEEFQENHPEINVKLNLAHDGKILPEDIRLILFRIYQHSIMNILRHADACEVAVNFTFDAEEARLEIQDDGTGFVVPTNWMELVRQGHYGLAGAVERVSLLDGSFSVESKPGKGTVVRVIIPLINGIETNGESKDES